MSGSLLLSLCVTSIAASMATLLMSPRGNDRGDRGKRLTGIHRMSESSYPLDY